MDKARSWPNPAERGIGIAPSTSMPLLSSPSATSPTVRMDFEKSLLPLLPRTI